MTGSTSIGSLAKRWGMPRMTLWRRLMCLHRDYPGHWLVRHGRTWAVNVTMLRTSHPELFQQPDQRDFSLRLLSLESALKQVRGRVATIERASRVVTRCNTDDLII